VCAHEVWLIDERPCNCHNGRIVDDIDRQDVAASCHGDEDAFARLVRRHTPAVAGLLWRFTREPHRREELVQEVFVEAFLGLRRYRGDAPFEHWLRRIATRVGYRFWKRRDRAPVWVSLDDFDIAAPEAEEDAATAGAVVHVLLGRLPPKERLVLTLMYFEDCTTKDIARRMGWTQAMVKMRAYRARRRLQAIGQREHLLEKLG
jgi:RNA polymerase sigma-70 factor, ECF subfamily